MNKKIIEYYDILEQKTYYYMLAASFRKWAFDWPEKRRHVVTPGIVAATKWFSVTICWRSKRQVAEADITIRIFNEMVDVEKFHEIFVFQL